MVASILTLVIWLKKPLVCYQIRCIALRALQTSKGVLVFLFHQSFE